MYGAKLVETLHTNFPKYEKFVFCNSEPVVMKSLRVARAISKNNLIISVTGSWHGSTSSFFYKQQ